MLVQGHFAAGERAGLVAAQNIDAAEVLHRLEMLDDHFLSRHVHGALAQRDRRDHRQELGRQSNRERDGEKQRLEKVVMKDDAHQQNKEHQQNGRLHDQETKLSCASFELGFRRLGGKASGDVAEGGVLARGHDQGCSRAADYGSAQKDFVLVACVRARLPGGQRHLSRRGVTLR